jgi:hypothetical protein
LACFCFVFRRLLPGWAARLRLRTACDELDGAYLPLAAPPGFSEPGHLWIELWIDRLGAMREQRTIGAAVAGAPLFGFRGKAFFPLGFHVKH